MRHRLSWFDRYLTLWIFLTMFLGVLAVDAFPGIARLWDSFAVGTTQPPISRKGTETRFVRCNNNKTIAAGTGSAERYEVVRSPEVVVDCARRDGLVCGASADRRVAARGRARPVGGRRRDLAVLAGTPPAAPASAVVPFLLLIPVSVLAGFVTLVAWVQAGRYFALQEPLWGLVGQPVADVHFTDLETDEPRSLASYRGQVVVVNRWATWCDPCTEEFPELERIQKDYRGRGVVVLLLSDESPEIQRRFFERRPGALERGYAEEFPGLPAPAFPTTYIVDRQGVIQRAFVGTRSYEGFARAIEPYL